MERVPPIVMSGQLGKDEIAELLEKITVSHTKSENNEINPQGIRLNPIENYRDTEGTKHRKLSRKEKKLCQFPSVIEVMEFKVPDIKCAFQISIGKDNKP